MHAHQWVACACGLLLTVGGVRAEFVEEYFNDYGTVDASIQDKGSVGDGWADAWFRGSVGNYNQGSLSFSQTGYGNDGNQQGSDDGVIGFAGGAQFTGRNLTDTISGTVWISYIGYLGTDTYRSFCLTTDAIYFGVEVNGAENNAFYKLGHSATPVFGTTDYGATDVHLILAKLEINISGTNDRFTMWVDPVNLTGGEAGLGAYDLQLAGSNFTGSFSTIYVFDSQTSKIDALRIAYGDEPTSGEKLAMVLIPEPLTLGLIGMGGLLLARRRR